MAAGTASTVLALFLASAGPPGQDLPGPGPAAQDAVVLREVRRIVLADRVRVTIDFEEPVTYTTERLDSPPRVYFDFPGTLLGGTVPEGTLQFTDDVVRHIRVGRRPNRVTRVVLDLDGVSRLTIVTGGPANQVVVDCVRARGLAVAPAPPPERPPVPATAKPAAARGIVSAGIPGREPLRPAARALSLTPYPPSPEGLGAAFFRPAIAATASATAAPPAASAQGATAPAAAAAPPAPVSAKPSTPSPAAKPPGDKPALTHPAVSLARQLGLGASRIVIDPGHGGHDPGAQAGGLDESDIVLDVALRLEKLLTQAGDEVVLTRRGNDYVPLEDRTAIANREQGDLFLSIHANAHRNRAISGIETYVLDFASDANAEAVAARENAATGHTMSNLPEMVKAIALNSKLDESRAFAGLIQREMTQQLKSANKGLHDLGVKQAPFVVLIGASMPAALVEISFITNSQERALLKSPQYRQKVADALSEAIQGYQKSLKAAGGVALR